MTLIANYPSLKIQVHDLRQTINTRHMIPEFHRCFTMMPNKKTNLYQTNLYQTKNMIFEYDETNKDFIVKNDNIKLFNNKIIYKVLDQFLYLTDVKKIDDKVKIELKFQRRKAKPYISQNLPEILFPQDYAKVGIFCVNNHNITNNVYEFLSSPLITDTLVNITKFELSPGFMCVLKSANLVSMIPSAIKIDDPYIDEGYEDVIILSYHPYSNNANNIPYINNIEYPECIE